MAATLRLVAEEAGVSIATVSLVLSGQAHRYRAETRDRVVAAAAKLGYRPNASARFMQRGRFGIIGLLNPVDQRVGTLPHGILDGASRALEERDHYLLLVRMDRDRLLDGTPPPALAERMTDGFLVNLHLRVRPEEEAAIGRLGTPCVWLNHQGPAHSVHPDDAGAGRLLCGLMLRAGHRRIAFADCVFGAEPDPEHTYLRDRRAGTEAACAEAGLGAGVILSRGWLHPDQRVAWARSWLSAPDRPTAVVTGNRETAGAIVAAAISLGIRTPEDLSLATVEERPIGDYGLDLATALTPVAEIGARAAIRLLALIDRDPDPPPGGAVPFTVDPGRSIAPPPA